MSSAMVEARIVLRSVAPVRHSSAVAGSDSWAALPSASPRPVGLPAFPDRHHGHHSRLKPLAAQGVGRPKVG